MSDDSAEIARLEAAIARVQAENAMLVAEINQALTNISILQNNLVEVHNSVEPRLSTLKGEVQFNSEQTEEVRTAIKEMSTQYFTFKALSTATKNVTRYTDEYHTRFSYYNNLRRITLGYVIGLDGNFVSNENMRETVEKAYLQNSQYWLAYATMAMMLWASDEQEAAKRALDKALFMQPQKAALYFMLINLRFSRTQTAQNWFLNYMERVNPSDLGEEWQYLLQAYLSGAFGENEAFQAEVGKYFRKMIVQSEATKVDFNKRFVDRSCTYANNYLHQTKETFSYLKQTCSEYDLLMQCLSSAEKNAVLAQYYDKLHQEEDDRGQGIYQRIENVLYGLVNSYDDDELEVVKKIKLNEHIISAKGDQAAARRKFDEEFGKPADKDFGDLLMDWSFVEDSNITPLSVRHFALSCMKKWIIKGYEKHAEQYREKVKYEYTFNVDGCQVIASENDFTRGKNEIETYYQRNKWKNVLADKFVKIYGLIAIAGLVTLIIMAIRLAGGHFSPVALTIGILLVLGGVFMFWRQSVSMIEQLKEKQRVSLQRFSHALEELAQWRNLFMAEDSRLGDLQAALMQFGNGSEQEGE